MRGAVEKNSDGMEGCQCSEVEGILTLSREIYINLVEDAVSKVGLLV